VPLSNKQTDKQANKQSLQVTMIDIQLLMKFNCLPSIVVALCCIVDCLHFCSSDTGSSIPPEAEVKLIYGIVGIIRLLAGID